MFVSKYAFVDDDNDLVCKLAIGQTTCVIVYRYLYLYSIDLYLFFKLSTVDFRRAGGGQQEERGGVFTGKLVLIPGTEEWV